MTDFVESFSTMQLLPPWISPGARTWMFLIRLNPKTVTDYLAAFLNAAAPDRAPFEWRPIDGDQFGIITYNQHPRVATDRPDRPQGWDTVCAKEVFFAFPAIRRQITADNLIVDTQVWVQPFSFGDTGAMVFGSREIWGTEMELARIFDEDDMSPGGMHVDVAIQGFKTFAPTSVSASIACLHLQVRPGGRIANPIPEILARPELHTIAGIFLQSSSFIGGGAPALTPDNPLTGTELNNLKQFRDAYNPEFAIYRAIVASKSSHQIDEASLAFFDPTSAEIDFMWSASMEQALQSQFALKTWTVGGPPAAHAPKVDAHGVDWDMKAARLKAELVFTYVSTVRYQVLGTLHTYGG
ncbi:MAG TPA: hypothetical protein VGS12_11000 [Caulobacteraceae bacterium]|nr:hypothetical protein [Caulobacteraceae bacterium]